MMSSLIERKMMQMILFQYQLLPGVIRALYECHIFLQFKGKNFEGFLNHLDNKHTMFHFFYHKTRCCMCKCLHSPRFNKQLLNEKRFQAIFCERAGKHVETSAEGTRIKCCICNVNVKPGATIDTFDTTLLVSMFQYCFKSSGVEFNLLQKIRDIRNKIAHASSLWQFSEEELDTMFCQAEDVAIKLAKIIKLPSYEKSVRTQIDLLRLATIRQVELQQMIPGIKSILEADKDEIIDLLSKTREVLYEKLDHHKELLQENASKTDEIKSAVTENLRKQEEIKKTQGEHTDQLNSVQIDSKEIKKITTETQSEQSRQTSVIEDIQNSVEHLKAGTLDEEAKDALRKINKTIVTCISEGEKVEEQTDIEKLQFKFEEHSKSVLECTKSQSEEIKTQYESLETKLQAVQKEILQEIDVRYQTDIEKLKFEMTEHSNKVLKDIQTVTNNVQTQHIPVKNMLESIQSKTDNIDKQNTNVATMMSCIQTRTGEIQTLNATLNAVFDRTETLEQKLETILNQKVENLDETNAKDVLKMIEDNICGSNEKWKKHEEHICEICLNLGQNWPRTYGVLRSRHADRHGVPIQIFQELKEAINSQLLVFQSHLSELVGGKRLTTGTIQQAINSVCLEMTKTLQNNKKILHGVKHRTCQCNTCYALVTSLWHYFEFCENCISEYVFDSTEMPMAFPHNTHNSTRFSLNAYKLYLEISIMRVIVEFILRFLEWW